MAKPDLRITLNKDKNTQELGAAWAGTVFDTKYGQVQSYGVRLNKEIKRVKIQVEWADGRKETYEPMRGAKDEREGDTWLNVMMDVPGGNEEENF